MRAGCWFKESYFEARFGWKARRLQKFPPVSGSASRRKAVSQRTWTVGRVDFFRSRFSIGGQCEAEFWRRIGLRIGALSLIDNTGYIRV